MLFRDKKENTKRLSQIRLKLIASGNGEMGRNGECELAVYHYKSYRRK